MTTKQIAGSVGKPEKTVRTWASKMAAKSADAAAKLAEATSSKPVNWTLDETIEIVRIGLGANAASLFRDNAEHKDTSDNNESVTRSDLAEFGRALVGEMMKQFLPLIQAQPKQLDYVQDYYSVLGYANKKNIRLTFSEGIALGKRATKLSRETGKEKREVDDERYGRVGSYHIDVLKEIFKQ